MKDFFNVRSLATGAVALTIACELIALPAAAQGTDTVRLKTVVVSAAKSPVSRDELTQSVTVLSGDDLRARGVARVSDALQLVPGVTLAQNGSFGSVSSLFLRGGESRYTKVLIDGVAVNQAGGYFDFSHLTTDNVDRIEIVRGPASVLYGADAVTGIIQIFTRQGRGPLALSASARGGTYGTGDGDVGINGSSNGVAYSLDGAEHKSDGVFKFNNQYYNGTLSGSLALTQNAATDARVSARYTNAEFHYPTDFTGAPVDSNSYRVQHRLTLGLDAGTAVTPRLRARFLAGTNEVSDLTEDITVPFGSPGRVHSRDFSRGYRRAGEARVELALPMPAKLSVGVEYVRERERSSSSAATIGFPASPASQFTAERSVRAAYGELLGTLARRMSYNVAARIDDNSDYKSYATYQGRSERSDRSRDTTPRVARHRVQCSRIRSAAANALHGREPWAVARAQHELGSRNRALARVRIWTHLRELVQPAFQRSHSVRCRRAAGFQGKLCQPRSGPIERIRSGGRDNASWNRVGGGEPYTGDTSGYKGVAGVLGSDRRPGTHQAAIAFGDRISDCVATRRIAVRHGELRRKTP